MRLKRIALVALICGAPWASAQADHVVIDSIGRVRTVPMRTSVQTVVQSPMTRIQVTGTRPLQMRTVTESVLISPKQSDFIHRLDMLKDQIELGKRRGMLNPAAAATLSDEQARLSSTAATMQSNGFIASEDTWMEKSINVLNRLVSDAMQ